MQLIQRKRGVIILDDDFVIPAKGQGSLVLHYSGYVALVKRVKSPNGDIVTKRIPVHRIIMNPPEGLVVDHINGNPSDNRRCNLRICTISQNNQNRHTTLGISWHKQAKRWQVQITVDGRSKYLGIFPTKEEAMTVRRSAEIRHFGEFAPSRSVNYGSLIAGSGS